MTQSPPDKMPDIFPDGHKFDTSTYLTAPEGSPRLITAEQWKEYQSLKATLADDLARVEEYLMNVQKVSDQEWTITAMSTGDKETMFDGDATKALTIIRRLRGNQ